MVCDYALDYLGGAQSVFLDEIALLRAAGDEVLAIAPQPLRQVSSSVRTDEPGFLRAVAHIPGVDLPVLVNTGRLRRRVRRLLEGHGIDAVHAHSEFGLTAATMTVAQDLRIPVVHTVHTLAWPGVDGKRLDRIAAAAVRGVVRVLRGRPSTTRVSGPDAVARELRGVTLSAAGEADAVISPSAHQAAALRTAGVHHVSVVPNPMLSGGPGGEPLTHVEGSLRIAWIGRVAKEKRIVEFLQAVAAAAAALGPDALDVTVVGDGPMAPEARAAAELAFAATGARIRFTGRVGRDEVDRTIRSSHLVALTSFGYDNQPVVVAEAFRAARSVLYVDPRLTEGLAEAGILCATPGVTGMAAMLQELAQHPEIVIHRSAQTVAASRLFDPDRHVRTLHDLYVRAGQRQRLSANFGADRAHE